MSKNPHLQSQVAMGPGKWPLLICVEASIVQPISLPNPTLPGALDTRLSFFLLLYNKKEWQYGETCLCHCYSTLSHA